MNRRSFLNRIAGLFGILATPGLVARRPAVPLATPVVPLPVVGPNPIAEMLTAPSWARIALPVIHLQDALDSAVERGTIVSGHVTGLELDRSGVMTATATVQPLVPLRFLPVSVVVPPAGS